MIPPARPERGGLFACRKEPIEMHLQCIQYILFNEGMYR